MTASLVLSFAHFDGDCAGDFQQTRNVLGLHLYAHRQRIKISFKSTIMPQRQFLGYISTN